MSENKLFDIAVVGAGMVGATTAILLSKAGFSVILIEARQPAVFDDSAPVGLRVSALSPGSVSVLEQTGAWTTVASSRCCPYQSMHVEDGADGQAIDFEAPVFGLPCLGTIVENDLLQHALWQIAGFNPELELACPEKVVAVDQQGLSVALHLDSGRRVNARMVVAAEGANSAIRKLTGVDQQVWSYNQKGLVSVVRKSSDNPGTAWQRFSPDSVLAFLPLADGASSIVWTLASAEADRLQTAEEEQFIEVLNQASAGWLGDVVSCGPRAVFPLSMRLSRKYVAGRVVLLGDSAHVVHPLAGQGVNLGLSDAAALVEVLIRARNEGKDLADAVLLRKYERWRTSESELMAAGIHGLRALFMPQALTGIRKLGLGMVARSWHLREAFLQRAAGRGSNAPQLAQGATLQSLVRYS